MESRWYWLDGRVLATIKLSIYLSLHSICSLVYLSLILPSATAPGASWPREPVLRTLLLNLFSLLQVNFNILAGFDYFVPPVILPSATAPAPNTLLFNLFSLLPANFGNLAGSDYFSPFILIIW